MSKTYRATVADSLVQGLLILFNIIALASFFFIQVGSLFFIIPAVILDVMYMLGREQVGPRKDAIQPSHQIMKMVLLIILSCMIIFSAIFLLQLYKAA